MATEQTQTVWSATYDLLRALQLTTVFGNPGSTEQPLWQTASHKQRGDLRWSICTRPPVLETAWATS